MEVLDAYIYDRVNTQKERIVMGSIYVEAIVPNNLMMATVFVNGTSQAAAAAWGGMAHSAFLAA
jgi:hypothetical protein